MRRALGFKLVECEKQLANFVAYMEGADASTVTTELALTWATRPTSATPAWWSERLIMVGGFARHLQAIDPATEVPPVALLPHRPPRVNPHLYSDAEIGALMAAAPAVRLDSRLEPGA